MFIHLRLQLLDRQYRLDADRHLWQSYLNLGSEEKFWPVRFFFLLMIMTLNQMIISLHCSINYIRWLRLMNQRSVKNLS
jgi:hypothetical protein